MDTLFDPVKKPDCIGFMALNLAHPTSFRPRIIKIAGEPQNPQLKGPMFLAGAAAMALRLD
jgi:hypothetical protein